MIKFVKKLLLLQYNDERSFVMIKYKADNLDENFIIVCLGLVKSINKV